MKSFLITMVASAAFLVAAAPAQSQPNRPIQTPDHNIYCKTVSYFIARNVGVGCWLRSSKYRNQYGQYRYRMLVAFWVNTKVERASISAERHYPKARVVRPNGDEPTGQFQKEHGVIRYTVSRRHGEWGIKLESALDYLPDERSHGFYLSRARVRVW
jgi:hypothetical protein